MLVCSLTTIDYTKSINRLARFKLNDRTALKKQPISMSQIHLREIMGNMDRVNKLKDHKLKLNVNGTDITSYDSITLLGVDIDNALNVSTL